MSASTSLDNKEHKEGCGCYNCKLVERAAKFYESIFMFKCSGCGRRYNEYTNNKELCPTCWFGEVRQRLLCSLTPDFDYRHFADWYFEHTNTLEEEFG